MKKTLLLLIGLVIWTNYLFGQDGSPRFIVPVQYNSEQFYETYYSEEKTYRCEDWLSTYMQLYQSNNDKKLQILTPDEKYGLIKTSAQNDGEAKFIFDIFYTKVFTQNAPSSVVEELLKDIPNYNLINSNTIDQELLVTGVMIPFNTKIEQVMKISAADKDNLFAFVDKVEFFASRNGNGGGGNGVLVAMLNGNNSSDEIDPAILANVEILVTLKTGRTFKYFYSHTSCTVDPVDVETTYEPTLPPNPPTSDPPVIPQLDGDCNILPTYYNNPLTGNEYLAQFSFADPSPKKYQKVWTPYYIPQNGVPVQYWHWENVEIPNPYSSPINPAVFGPNGKISTAVYLNPYHTRVTKPIIITDGIDFLSNRKFKEIYAQFGGNEMISTLWDGGYDVIFADFAGGADFIQRNSFALIELIRSLRHEQEVEKIEAIIGPSMGGQVIRHALLYWEKNLESNPSYGNHNINLFVSADSPWSGANASPAVQGFARINKNGSATMMLIDKSASSPAACQLLLNHIDGVAPYTTQDYIPSQHYLKTEFDLELASLGSLPEKIQKIIAIADGSGNGSTENVKPGGIICAIEYKTCNSWYLSECQFLQNLEALNSNEYIISKSCKTISGLGISCNNACDKFPTIRSTATSRLFDSCPASPFDLTNYFEGIETGQIIYQEGGFKIIFDRVNLSETFSFIPTFSALGMSQSNAFTDFSQIVTETPYGFVLPGSPFDFVYFDDKDSGHNSFETSEQAGSIPFILSNLEYEKIYSTKCLTSENMQAPEEPIYADQGHGVFQYFCLPFEYEDYYFPGENKCEIDLVNFDGDNIYALTSNFTDGECHDLVDVCFVTECDEKCIKLQVYTYPISGQISLNEESVFSDVNFTILPNPSNGSFEIEGDLAGQQIQIINTMGQSIKFEKSGNKIHLDDNLSNGIYMINFIDESTLKVLANRKIMMIK